MAIREGKGKEKMVENDEVVSTLQREIDREEADRILEELQNQPYEEDFNWSDDDIDEEDTEEDEEEAKEGQDGGIAPTESAPKEKEESSKPRGRKLTTKVTRRMECCENGRDMMRIIKKKLRLSSLGDVLEHMLAMTVQHQRIAEQSFLAWTNTGRSRRNRTIATVGDVAPLSVVSPAAGCIGCHGDDDDRNKRRKGKQLPNISLPLRDPSKTFEQWTPMNSSLGSDFRSPRSGAFVLTPKSPLSTNLNSPKLRFDNPGAGSSSSCPITLPNYEPQQQPPPPRALWARVAPPPMQPAPTNVDPSRDQDAEILQRIRECFNLHADPIQSQSQQDDASGDEDIAQQIMDLDWLC